MIIKKLLELCLSLLTSLLSNVGSIPALPEQILTIFQTVINYMVSGIDLLGLFIGPTALTFIGVCLDVIIALNLFYFGYSCVMWFVKKIPFLGIKQPFAPDLRKQRGQRLFPALCSRGLSCFFFLDARIPRPVQERPRPVCIATPTSNAQGGRWMRSTKPCFPLSLSLLQNRRTTTSDFVVFVVFVGILIWYTLFLSVLHNFPFESLV